MRPKPALATGVPLACPAWPTRWRCGTIASPPRASRRGAEGRTARPERPAARHGLRRVPGTQLRGQQPCRHGISVRPRLARAFGCARQLAQALAGDPLVAVNPASREEPDICRRICTGVERAGGERTGRSCRRPRSDGGRRSGPYPGFRSTVRKPKGGWCGHF